MAPVWAHAKAVAPIKKDKRAALAAKREPFALRNQRDTFKIFLLTVTPLHTIEPGIRQKVVSKVPNGQEKMRLKIRRGKQSRQTITANNIIITFPGPDR
jgi:hypothetical protein